MFNSSNVGPCLRHPNRAEMLANNISTQRVFVCTNGGATPYRIKRFIHCPPLFRRKATSNIHHETSQMEETMISDISIGCKNSKSISSSTDMSLALSRPLKSESPRNAEIAKSNLAEQTKAANHRGNKLSDETLSCEFAAKVQLENDSRHATVGTTTTTEPPSKCAQAEKPKQPPEIPKSHANPGGQYPHPPPHPSSHSRLLPKTQSLDIVEDRTGEGAEYFAKSRDSLARENMGKISTLEQTRPIYPNVPYSPYGSPYGSPRFGRRRTPLRESSRISIEQSGSFLQLNQYKLLDSIGQGSYGLVKLAYSEEDSTHYAMKILSKRKLLRKAGILSRGPRKPTSPLDRVYKEIAVLKKLDHPNVVKLIEVMDDPLEDSLYLAFELVQQGEVLSIPTDKPLSEERCWSVFRDSLLGLEYLHYQKIIHGDIKPGNLLLGECGRVKIADLGVCNEFLGEDAAMNNGSTAGTPAFRAPETLHLGQHSYNGKAADIWALGATLYALVFGNVPFMAKSVPAVYEKIKNDDIVFPTEPKISSDLKDLITKILQKDPNLRINLPQIKVHNWVTANGLHHLPSEEDNCRLIQISDEDMSSVVKSIPKLDTLILIKTMLKKHSFQNPFITKTVSGRASQRGRSRLEKFTRAGRSNSAPGVYHTSERQLSSDNLLPSVKEGMPSSSENPVSEDDVQQ
uniref:calcium/calmodulin-dependent protein kinase n=1 Tax=Lutzomyia longipalpis TaxID=7200 RepID=A0A7G3AE88_LUTLO